VEFIAKVNACLLVTIIPHINIIKFFLVHHLCFPNSGNIISLFLLQNPFSFSFGCFLFCCYCAGWGFINFITMYQIYHLLHHSLLFQDSYLCNSFNRYHFSISKCVYTVFALHSPSYTLSPPPNPSHWYQPQQAGPVLPSCSLIL
jgi:hypothetical protein